MLSQIVNKVREVVPKVYKKDNFYITSSFSIFINVKKNVLICNLDIGDDNGILEGYISKNGHYKT